MSEERIEIEIDEEGNIKAEKHGGGGAGCLTELDALLSGAGEKTVSKKKPEFSRRIQNTSKKKVTR